VNPGTSTSRAEATSALTMNTETAVDTSTRVEEYTRAARAAASAPGDRRRWTLPELEDAAPTVGQVLGWVRQVLAVAWRLANREVGEACSALEHLFAELPRPLDVELLRHFDQNQMIVVLAVTTRPVDWVGSDDAGRQIAVVRADMESRG